MVHEMVCMYTISRKVRHVYVNAFHRVRVVLCQCFIIIMRHGTWDTDHGMKRKGKHKNAADFKSGNRSGNGIVNP